jgi:hypothetical protein
MGAMIDHRRVKINGRIFIVDLDEKLTPLRIKERKIFEKGRPWERFYDITYWHAGHHALGASWTLPRRIIEKALGVKK